MESKFCTFHSFSRNANYKINTICKTQDKSKDQMEEEKHQKQTPVYNKTEFKTTE